MALIWFDSFDHYGGSTTASLRKWTASRNASGPSLTSGRFGNGWDGFSSRWSYKTLPSSFTSGVVGLALIAPSGGDNIDFIQFREAGVGVHVGIRRNFITGKLQAYRGRSFSGGTLLGEVAWAPGGAWHYVEIKVTIHDSTGAVEIRVDGTAMLTLTGQDTRNGGTGIINQIALGDADNGNVADNIYIDDLYVLDTSGSAPTNDYLGDCRVECKFPNGNGNSSQFVGSDANSTDNYLLVDETAPNDDTDYVESGTVNNKDTYAYQDLAVTSGTVYGVQILPYVRKTDAGLRKMATVTRLSGTEVDSADMTLSTTYEYFPVIQEAKPGGGVWTIADVNAAEFGVKVTA